MLTSVPPLPSKLIIKSPSVILYERLSYKKSSSYLFYFSMEEVLTNSDAVRTGWMILLAQLFVSILVAMFIVKKARMELDKILLVKKCQIISETDLNLFVCEK